MEYGLMKYSYTINMGNEIQSIAARRFLPKIDYYIEHEQLNLFQSPEKVKMIMNGWYFDCIKSWPPSDSIDPLLISMHFNLSRKDTGKILTSQKSKDFLSSYGPVGCRDYPTLKLLNKLDIDAYYSGCLTLTLERKKTKTDEGYIVVNSFESKKTIDFLKTKTDLPIYDIKQVAIPSLNKKYLKRMPTSYKLTSFYDYNEKFFLAENLLRIYEHAHCVITDRVHCAFPCLAFKTPVLFFNSAKYEPERFEGIGELILESNFEEYKNNYDLFNVENPPKNSKNYLKIREDLIKKTKSFTGHLSDSYKLDYDDNEIIKYQTLLSSNTCQKTKEYMHGVINLSKIYESKLSNKDKIIKEKEQSLKKQESIIKEMQNSNSWKMTKPLRKIGSIIRRDK